jgi:hypothetical protein
MTPEELADAAWQELTLTTDSYPKWKQRGFPSNTHWGKAKAYLDQIKDTEPTPDPDPVPVPTTKIQWAVNASDWYDASHNPNLVKNLGAKVVREARSAPISSGDVHRYTDVGIKLLWELNVGASAANVKSAIENNGGKNSFWGVEYGNENAYTYSNPNYSNPSPGSYAQGAKSIGQICKLLGIPFGIQLGSDALRGSAWVDGMYAAVPDLNNYFDAWIIHPYGPPRGSSLNRSGDSLENGGERRCEAAVAHAKKWNAWDSKVFWFTEFGLAFAYPNAITLDDNYGWIRNMSPTQAKQALDETEAMWARLFGDKLRFVSIYHDFDTHGTGTGRESYFGTVKADGTTKGPFTDAIKQRLAQ